jgi:LacI family transcriptional regulator
MAKNVTIQDVADRAEVSIGTVSRVLNGGAAATETREKVLEAASKLEYRVNLFARGMRGSRKNCIGILIEGAISDEDPWLESIMVAMSRVISRSGYHCMVDFWEGGESDLPKMLDNVDGCMLLGHYPEEFFGMLDERIGLPLVTYDEKMPYENGEVLSVDWKAGMYEVIGYLLALEHARVGLVIAGLDYPSLRERYRGYLEALPQYGREVDESVIKTYPGMGRGPFEEAYQLTGDLLKEQPEVTAIVYGSDTMAVAGMQKLRSTGRRVPQDVSVVGFDDSAWAQVTVPALTTEGVNYRELSGRMLEALRALIGERDAPPKLTMKPELIRRSSAARRGTRLE